QVGNRSTGAEVTAELREAVAHFGHRTVLVVGQRLDQDGHATRTIAFIHQFLEIVVVGGAGTPRNGSVNRITGHVGAQGLVHRRTQTRVIRHLVAAQLGRYRQFTDYFGEDLRTLGILTRLAVLDIGPF